MFTPQKVTKQYNNSIYSSNNFEGSLRNYQSSNKQQSQQKDLSFSIHRDYAIPFSNEDRLQRYKRVRQEQMARSRSKIRQIRANKQIMKNITSLKSFNSIRITLQDKQNIKQIVTQQIASIGEDRISKQFVETKQQFISFCTPMQLQNNQNMIEETPNETQIQHQTPIIQSDPMIQQKLLNEELLVIEQTLNQGVICTNMDMQVQQNCYDCSFDYCDASVTFYVQQSQSCILIRNKTLNYRISLRQLNNIFKKMNNIDSLVHFIANQKPHLAPMKQLIAEALNKHLY